MSRCLLRWFGFARFNRLRSGQSFKYFNDLIVRFIRPIYKTGYIFDEYINLLFSSYLHTCSYNEYRLNPNYNMID